MTQLAQQLREEITASGALFVSHYMQRCLLDSAHGYYSTKQVFGADGDFITAPEISQLFGEMLAAFLGHLHELSGAPSSAVTFEAGPGRATLACDMRRTYQMIAPALYQAPCYLLEASHALREAQSAALAPMRPHFISAISDLPAQPLFGIANEFFDALGVDQVIFHNGAWHHRKIGLTEDAFSYVIDAPLTAEEHATFTLPEAPEAGDICEICPTGEAILAELARHIAHYGGALLICDYGKADNLGDSLQAVRNHKPSDLLSYQGESDITHWVDFAALSRVASANQARLIGPVSQGRFLTEIGIAERAEALRQPDKPEQDRALLAAIDRLVSPAQMGHAFKVCLLVPDGEGLPPGFTSFEAS